MNILMVVEYIVSFGLVIVCWWLAHQNSGGREPFKRAIAAGYSLLAMSVSASLLIQNVGELKWLVPWAELAERAILAVTLGVVAARLTRLYAPPPGH